MTLLVISASFVQIGTGLSAKILKICSDWRMALGGIIRRSCLGLRGRVLPVDTKKKVNKFCLVLQTKPNMGIRSSK